ncbi:MAG: hypothetical protein V3V20_08705 [Algisphaera sp.]
MSPVQIKHVVRHYRRALHVALGMAAVGLLLWGRLILKEAPRTATADGPNLVQADTPTPITSDLGLSDVKQGNLGSLDDQRTSQHHLNPLLDSNDAGSMQAAQSAAAELTLQGMTTGKVPVARINGRLIRVGDTIEGFMLMSIEGQTAVLEKDGTSLHLTASP